MAPVHMLEKRLKLSRKNLVLLQFLLEGYEGMAMVTTLDDRLAVVQVFILPDFLQETLDILYAVKNELDFEWLPA